jgi:regulatory protein
MNRSVSQIEALQRLQKYCAYQDRCHQEVRSKLLKLGIFGDALEEIISELISDGFLNESRFARSFVRGKFRQNHWGRQRILLELKKKNVSEYCIREGLQEIKDEEYLETLQEVIRRKDGSLKEDDPYKRRAKLAQFAIRRGFEAELVWDCLKGMAD